MNDRRTKPPEFREYQGQTLLKVEHGPLPFGWQWHETQQGWAKKNPEQHAALDKAKQFIANGCTYVDTARWLGKECGRPVSDEGLKYIIVRGY